MNTRGPACLGRWNGRRGPIMDRGRPGRPRPSRVVFTTTRTHEESPMANGARGRDPESFGGRQAASSADAQSRRRPTTHGPLGRAGREGNQAHDPAPMRRAWVSRCEHGKRAGGCGPLSLIVGHLVRIYNYYYIDLSLAAARGSLAAPSTKRAIEIGGHMTNEEREQRRPVSRSIDSSGEIIQRPTRWPLASQQRICSSSNRRTRSIDRSIWKEGKGHTRCKGQIKENTVAFLCRVAFAFAFGFD
jgi:hypothetical protein